MTYKPELKVGPKSPGVWKEVRRLEGKVERLRIERDLHHEDRKKAEAEVQEKHNLLIAASVNLTKVRELLTEADTELDDLRYFRAHSVTIEWHNEQVQEFIDVQDALMVERDHLRDALQHIAENGSGGNVLDWVEFAGDVLAELRKERNDG